MFYSAERGKAVEASEERPSLPSAAVNLRRLLALGLGRHDGAWVVT
jgi:hypothetical protein